MRIGKKFEIDLYEIIIIGGIIVSVAFILSSCATYPNQKSVIKPRSEAKANFR